VAQHKADCRRSRHLAGAGTATGFVGLPTHVPSRVLHLKIAAWGPSHLAWVGGSAAKE
jgi:hypothetical protein